MLKLVERTIHFPSVKIKWNTVFLPMCVKNNETARKISNSFRRQQELKKKLKQNTIEKLHRNQKTLLENVCATRLWKTSDYWWKIGVQKKISREGCIRPV